MRRIALLPLTFSLLFPSSSVLALPTRTVFAEQAQGFSSSGIDLEVPPGYGLTINFIETGEVVKQAWIGDPSRFVFSSNGDLCPQGLQDSNCTNTGATVIFLRQIKPVDFPGLVSSSDGGTQLTLITEGVGGQKQYSFGLSAASRGKPKYTTLIVKPESENPVSLPIIPSRSTPAVSPPLLDQLPTITSSVQRQQTSLAENPSLNSTATTTATTRRSLAVPIPSPSFARAGARVSNNPAPETKWTPEVPRQPVRTPVPKQTSASASIAISRQTQPQISSPVPSSSRRMTQQPRVPSMSPTAKPQAQANKPKVSPKAIIRRSSSVALNSATSSVNTSLHQSIDDANAIAFGLRTANENGQIKTRTAIWRKAQSAIRALRQGKTRVQAAQIANIPQNTLEQLIKWGQERP